VRPDRRLAGLSGRGRWSDWPIGLGVDVGLFGVDGMNRVLLGLGVGVASIALAAGVQEGAMAAPDRIFRPIASQVKEQLPSGWKMRLPSSITAFGYEDKPIQLYAQSEDFNDSTFRVSLNSQQNCQARACYIGYLTVERGTNSYDALKSEPIFSKPDMARRRALRQISSTSWTEADRNLFLRSESAVLERSIVDLGSGIEGVFVVRSGMGVSTPAALVVSWKQDNQVYTIYFRTSLQKDDTPSLLSQKAILSTAESMVQARPIGETEVADRRSTDPTLLLNWKWNQFSSRIPQVSKESGNYLGSVVSYHFPKGFEDGQMAFTVYSPHGITYYVVKNGSQFSQLTNGDRAGFFPHADLGKRYLFPAISEEGSGKEISTLFSQKKLISVRYNGPRYNGNSVRQTMIASPKAMLSDGRSAYILNSGEKVCSWTNPSQEFQSSFICIESKVGSDENIAILDSIVSKKDVASVKPIEQLQPIALEGTLKLAANSKQGIQLKNPLSKQIQLTIRTSQKALWTFDPSKERNMHDANGYLYGSLTRDQNLLPSVRRGALIVRRNNAAGPYENIGTSANIILEPGEIVTFVMNESTYGTEDYADNKGELQINYKISESWSTEKPSLKIIPTRKEGFSDEQWDAIEIAVENWNKIISQDKDLSGKLRIVFTSDSKRIDDQTGKEIDWGEVHAKVFEIDKQVGKRVNYDYPNDFDLNEEDYDNRISFNKEWLGGSKPFFLPDACIEGIYPASFNTKKNMISLAMHEIGHILGLLHPDEAPYIDKAEVNPNESLMKAGCFRRGEKSITDHLIKSLEFQGYQVNRDAIKELKWE
jgi:Matrixin